MQLLIGRINKHSKEPDFVLQTFKGTRFCVTSCTTEKHGVTGC